MEALPRRAYNRLLWKTAAHGMGLGAHLTSAAAAVATAGARYLLRPDAFLANLPLNVGMSLALAVAVELGWLLLRRFFVSPHELYLAQLASSQQRDSQLGELKQQINRQPRPRLSLTYIVESLKGFEDEVANPPMLLHNDGDAAAVEAQIEPVQLTPLIKVTFAPVQRIGVRDSATMLPRVEIRTETGGWELEHNDRHLGLAIQRAHVELAHRNVKTQHGSRRWPIVVRYHDPSGASYTQNYDLMLHIPTMKAWTVLAS
jgi:hypothetical protein